MNLKKKSSSSKKKSSFSNAQKGAAIVLALVILGMFFYFGPIKEMLLGAIVVSFDDFAEVIEVTEGIEEFEMRVRMWTPENFRDIQGYEVMFQNGDDSLTCHIDPDSLDNDCTFLYVNDVYFDGIQPYRPKDYGYSYSYGYGYSPWYGYGYGYGYNYGYSYGYGHVFGPRGHYPTLCPYDQFEYGYSNDYHCMCPYYLGYGYTYGYYGYSYGQYGYGGPCWYGYSYGYGYFEHFYPCIKPESGFVTLDIELDPVQYPGDFFDSVTSVEGIFIYDDVSVASAKHYLRVKGESEEGDDIDEFNTEEFEFGKMTITVPPGTFTDGSTITAQQVNPEKATQGSFMVLGKTYDISTSSPTFDGAVTITIQLTPEELMLNGFEAGRDPFIPYYYDNGGWVEIPGSTWDPATLTCTFTTNHFTDFAVLGGSVNPPGASGGGSGGGGGGYTPCFDECESSSYEICSGGNLFTCGDYDLDNCLEWGMSVDCTFGCARPNYFSSGYCTDCLIDQDCRAGYECSGEYMCEREEEEEEEKKEEPKVEEPAPPREEPEQPLVAKIPEDVEKEKPPVRKRFGYYIGGLAILIGLGAIIFGFLLWKRRKKEKDKAI